MPAGTELTPDVTQSAIQLVKRGWYVFDVDHPDLPKCAGPRRGDHDPDKCDERGKHPCGPWTRRATINKRETIDRLTGRPRNIGIACGPSGLLVIDEDGPGEFAKFAASKGVEIPQTYTVSTGKGRHFYFRAPEGLKLGNTEGELGPYNCNVRGAGGYVIAPGSKHRGGTYYVADDPDADLADAPEWLVDALQTRSTSADRCEDAERFWWASGVIHSGEAGGRGRDNALFAAAAYGRHRGMAHDAAWPMVREVWSRCCRDSCCADVKTESYARAKLDQVYERYPEGNAPSEVPADYVFERGSTSGAADVDQGDAPVGRSWLPMDLSGVLSGDHVMPEPIVGMARQDGLRLLYPGREHSMIGEMESGKSWAACACSAAELTSSGKCVVYVHFEEEDPSGTVERLRALGVPDDTIATRFHYVAPIERADAGTISALAALDPSLVVLDGVNEAMSLHGWKIMDVEGAAEYRRYLVRPFKTRGAAILSLDHVTKDREGRGRNAFGTVHKGNGLDGSSFVLENVEPFGREQRGCSHVFVVKDRPACLRRRGNKTKTTGKTYIGSLIIDDTREHRSYLDMTFTVPNVDDESDDDETATVDSEMGDNELVLRTIAELAREGITANGRAIRARTGISKDRTALALERVTQDGEVIVTTGPRGPVLKGPGPVGTGPVVVPGPVPDQSGPVVQDERSLWITRLDHGRIIRWTAHQRATTSTIAARSIVRTGQSPSAYGRAPSGSTARDHTRR